MNVGIISIMFRWSQYLRLISDSDYTSVCGESCFETSKKKLKQVTLLLGTCSHIGRGVQTRTIFVARSNEFARSKQYLYLRIDVRSEFFLPIRRSNDSLGIQNV